MYIDKSRHRIIRNIESFYLYLCTFFVQLMAWAKAMLCYLPSRSVEN